MIVRTHPGGEPMAGTHEQFMEHVVKCARERMEGGGRPYYAMVVYDGKIVGQGPHPGAPNMDNSVNPVAHSEVNAIMEACTTLKKRNLSGATLYSSMEPCPMCLSTAVLEVSIKSVVIGSRHARYGRKDLGSYTAESFLAFTGHQDVELVTGIREAEFDALLANWMNTLTGEQVRRELLRSRA
jgi:tRNA(Arg) A34 adenosine deaminase TadA